MDSSSYDMTSTSRGAADSQAYAPSAGYLLTTYDRFASVSATLAGVIGLLYSISFVFVARTAPDLGGLLSALFLMLGGIFSSAALTGIYRRLVAGPAVETTFALWGFWLALGGALGAFIHGGYDLSNAIHPPVAAYLTADAPNPIDPRGLLTFGLAGLSLLVLSLLMARSPNFSRALSRLGMLLGILLMLVYLARLLILDAANPLVLYPAALTGFLINPIFYIWLGHTLSRP
jgi:hypothetical protein